MPELKIVVTCIVDVPVERDDHETRVREENRVGGICHGAMLAAGFPAGDVDTVAETHEEKE